MTSASSSYAAPSPAPRLTARDLAAGYRGRRVIDGLHLDLAPGKVTMIIGANASGKSTLLGTFARLRAPLSGRVELDGEDVVADFDIDGAIVTDAALQQNGTCA